MASYWEPDGNIIAGISNIPRFLSEQQSSCMEFNARFRRMRDSLSIDEDAKDELAFSYNRLCSFLVNMSSDLPGYYRHVNIFSKSILHAVSATEPRIETALAAGDNRDLFVEQRMIAHKVSGLITNLATEIRSSRRSWNITCCGNR